MKLKLSSRIIFDMVFLETFYAVSLSLRQLHQILRKPNLFRRYLKSNITEVTQAVLQNLSGYSKFFAIV